MRTARWAACTFLLSATALLPAPARAQGTTADYARAEAFRAKSNGLVIDAADEPTWLAHGDRFWYRKTVTGGHAFVLVDATTLQKGPAFDHARLAAALTSAMGKSITATTLPFARFTFADSGHAIEFTEGSSPRAPQPDTGRVLWHCTVTDYVCQPTHPRPDARRGMRPRFTFGGGLFGSPRPELNEPHVSPDGTWEALIRNYNVYVRPTAGGDGFMLSLDGSEGDAYDPTSITWSPDSRHLAAYRVLPGYKREVHYVESSPEDQLQPKYSTMLYNKPGDVLDKDQPVLFDVATHKQTIIDDSLFPNAYDVTALEWRTDGRAFTFEYNQRGHQVYRVIEVDANTGKARAVIDEEMPTFFEYSGKKFRFGLADGKEIIWMSERDGWNHLYLYDGITGKVKNQITKGDWVVRGVDWVDTTKRQIWFHASGMNAHEDPYFVQYYRIDFDGTHLTPLTDADGMHSVEFSPDHQYYVDEWSRVDLPPIMELRRASDQRVVMRLEQADDSALLATGWKPPMVFVAKGRDGKTDIWGVIIRPTNFNPHKKYPVIENIYAGPQGSFVPKTFSPQTDMQSLAELGFVVVQIDGMGTSNRSKAFHDVIWKNIKDAGFPDRILWHKAAAKKYPWYDISNVGIYGTSAGGQNALGALLFHPEFYKVAVASAGCYDNRMDKIWWNEQWMGWPIGPQYAASSDVDNAYRLQGKLLLTVGEMDHNVDPSSTFQVVNALIKAHKTFGLLVVPGADHGFGGEYGVRKRWDFFVHNLLHVEPPDRNAPSFAASAANGDR
ncbi:MAG TPA: DPP IV N-terminal domain-containing protein [Gemmatimonadaceae bacterium]